MLMNTWLSPSVVKSATHRRLSSTLILLGLALSFVAGCSGTPSALTALTITTTTLPSGSTQGAYDATVTATGGVGPFTWTVASGSLPPGLSLSASTTSSVTIVGTPANVGVSGPFSLEVQDSQGHMATSVTFTITVTNLAITSTSPLPAGTVGTAYSFQFAGTGGTAPLTWSVASGSTLPAGLTLSSSGLFSGTPTTAGTTTIQIKLADSESPSASITGTFSITISGPTGTALLNGHFAFTFSGFNSQGAVVAAGSFTADGAGHITAGVADYNFVQGAPKNETFTGTYTLGNDGRGTLVFNTSSLGTLTYAAALDSAGVHGRLIEFDSSGTRGSGEVAQQSISTCASSTLSGANGAGFVIGITGAEGNFSGSTPGPMALAGRFTAEVPPNSTTPGTIDTGEVDANVPQRVVVQDTTFSGTFQTSTQTARCTMSVSQSIGNMTFSVYPVLASSGTLTEAFIVETDTTSATEPYVSAGKLIQQVGHPFAQPEASFSAPSIGSLSGSAIPSGQTAFVPLVAVTSLTGTGSTGFTMSFIDNFGGTVGSFLGTSAVSASFVNADIFGRLDTSLSTSALAPISPVFYVIGPNTAICIFDNVSAPVLGFFEPQSGTTFSAATIEGSFVEGTTAPEVSAPQDDSGVVTLDGVSTVTGTQDTSTSTANTAAQTVTGTYSGISSTTGNGALAFIAPATSASAFFIVSPTKFVGITTTTGNADPVLTIYGDQADVFGVN